MDDWELLKIETTSVDEVIKDMRKRERMGFKKYKKFLTKHTDEDMLQHLYEELLDAASYIKMLKIQQKDST